MFKPLDDLFDFNHDGNMDRIETAAELAYMDEIGMLTNKSEDKFLSNDEEDLFADEMDELEIAGLDIMELAMMDSDERKEAIEDAGLNPDDYDFDWVLTNFGLDLIKIFHSIVKFIFELSKHIIAISVNPLYNRID